MAVIYDYECCRCGTLTEVIAAMDDTDLKPCPECQGDMVRIISISGVNCLNQDAGWLKTVTDVVGNETPEGREFKKNPTRANYHAWMKRKGLRPLEDGEKPSRPPAVDEDRMARQLYEKHRERTRIEL